MAALISMSRTIDNFGEDELPQRAKAHLAEFSQVGFTETFRRRCCANT